MLSKDNLSLRTHIESERKTKATLSLATGESLCLWLNLDKIDLSLKLL